MPAESTYTPIASQVLTNNTTVDIIFSNIPQTYTDLRLVFVGRTTQAGTASDCFFYISPYATDQSQVWTQGDGSTTSVGRAGLQNQNVLGSFPAAGQPTGMFGMAIIDIFNYTNTSIYKTFIIQNASNRNGTGIVFNTIGTKRNTAAVTQIVLFPAQNWAAGTRATLYGIKAA